MTATPMSATDTEFSGIYPYLVSPVDERGDVDEQALRRLVDHLVAAGVDGLSPLGSTGEVMYLTPAQRERIVKTTVDAAAGRVPVVAGVAEYASASVAREAEAMSGWGVDGLVGIQLSYGPAPVPAVVDYFSALAGATELPIVLYTNPRLGGDIPLAALEQLVAHDNIRYMKDATGITGRLLTVQSALGDRVKFFAASAHLPTAVFDLGGAGWMAGPACVVPEAAVAFWEAHRRGDLAGRDALQRAIWPLNALFTKHGLAPLIKLAVDEAGFPCGDPVAPQQPVAEAVRAEVRAVLDAVDVAVAEYRNRAG